MRIEGPDGIYARLLGPRDEIDLFECLRDWPKDLKTGRVTLEQCRKTTSIYIQQNDDLLEDHPHPSTRTRGVG